MKRLPLGGPTGGLRQSWVFAFLLSWLAALLPFSVAAEDSSVCARVKIEIEQEAALKRQAFDARMRITNAVPELSLEDVSVVEGVRVSLGRRTAYGCVRRPASSKHRP